MDKDARSRAAAETALTLKDEGPSQNLPLAINILDQLDKARELDRLLSHAVSEVLDLVPSQMDIMTALKDGPVSAQQLSSTLGLVDGEAELVIDSLSERDLTLSVPDGTTRLSETGRAMVDRVEAIRYRVADLASTRLSDKQLDIIGASLATIGDLSSERRLSQA